MVMSVSQGDTTALQARMPQVKGMLYVTARGTPPRPRCSSRSSEGTAVLPPSCFPPILAEPHVGVCVGVEFGRQFLTENNC